MNTHKRRGKLIGGDGVFRDAAANEKLLSIYIDGEIEGIDVNECFDFLVDWDDPEDIARCMKIAKAIVRLFESAGVEPDTGASA